MTRRTNLADVQNDSEDSDDAVLQLKEEVAGSSLDPAIIVELGLGNITILSLITILQAYQ